MEDPVAEVFRSTIDPVRRGCNSVDAVKGLRKIVRMSPPTYPTASRAPDPEALMAVQARLDEARATEPALEAAEIDEVLRIVPGKRAVLAGHWQGRPAVFRMVEPAEADWQAREWAEVARIWPQMQGLRYRVAEPLAYLPEVRIMAVERVAGTPLMEHLWSLEPEERALPMQQAAAWLRRYTDVSESWRAARPEGWLARAERVRGKQPFARLRQIEAGIAEHLARLAARQQGMEWRMAICHGDFHPNNLVLRGACLTGIDLGGSAQMPICKDIARCLAHMGRRGLLSSDRRHLGVDAAALDQFAETFALTETERRCTLPFFIGIEALIRVENRSMKRGRIGHAEEMYSTLCDDLAVLPG
jgi:hypothetical protein